MFLSHAGEDASIAKELARLLGHSPELEVWLDVERLQPGERWMVEIEGALQQSSAFLIYVGRAGVVRWVDLEMRVALDRAAKNPEYVIVPLLGPGSGGPEALPPFLRQFQALDCPTGQPNTEQLQTLIAQLTGKAAARVSLLPSDMPPYLGLRSFDTKHALLFFGRDREIEDLAQKVQANAFVSVVGASGSGKSSLVRAGLIPALNRGRLSGGDSEWRVAICRPGQDPFRELAEALPDLKPELAIGHRLAFLEGLADRLRAGRDGLRNSIVALDLKGAHVLIVVDQFEELFTLTAKDDDRKAFVALLTDAAVVSGSLPVRVVLTLRADYYARCWDFPRLLEPQFNVFRPGREQMREAIEHPMVLAGAEAEPNLVDMLLDDAGDEPGSLPLLEFALEQLWNMRIGNRLTIDTYVKIGRLRGAIARQAEECFTHLLPAEQQLARSVFSRLVRVSRAGEEGSDTRQTVRLDQLNPGQQTVAEKFQGARLLVLSGDEKDRRVEMAHEALLKAWERLRDWIEADRKFLLWLQAMNLFRAEWERTGRPRSNLLPETQLKEATAYLKTRKADFTSAERDFLIKSQSAYRRSNALAYALLTLFLAGGITVLAWWAFTHTDSYQVRDALRHVALRQAAMSSRSEEDPYLEAIQNWICVLVKSGRAPVYEKEIDSSLQDCGRITFENASSGRFSFPPQPVQRPGDDLACWSHLILAPPEKEALIKLAIDRDIELYRHPSYAASRDKIISAESLLGLGALKTASARASVLMDELHQLDSDQQSQLAGLLAARLGPALSSEQQHDLLALAKTQSYYQGIVSSSMEEATLFAKSPGELQEKLEEIRNAHRYNSEEYHLAGLLLSRLIRLGQIMAASDILQRFINSRELALNPEYTWRLAAPVAAALAETGHLDQALSLNAVALTAADHIYVEDRKSRAFADVAINLARCHRLVDANAVASRCTRSLDQLRAYTAIVAAGDGLPVPNPELWRLDPSRNFNPTCCGK